MPKLPLDKLSMDRDKRSAESVYEVRNVSPEEVHGVKKRHGSKIPSDVVNGQYSSGIRAAGDHSYLRIDDDVGDATFTVGFAVKVGDLQQATKGTASYEVLFCNRDASSTEPPSTHTGLPAAGIVIVLQNLDGTLKIGAGEIGKTLEYSVASISVGETLGIGFWRDGDLGQLLIDGKTGRALDSDNLSESGTASGNVAEFLGAENLDYKDPTTGSVIQQIYYRDNGKTSTLANIISSDRSSTNATHRYKLNGKDTTQSSAAIVGYDNGNNPTALLHLHPTRPEVLSNELQFGGGAGAFEVPYSPEFNALFDTQQRSVINNDWTAYFEVTLGPNFKSTTLCQFGTLFKLYFNATGHPVASFDGMVDGEGNTSWETLTNERVSLYSVGDTLKIAVSHNSTLVSAGTELNITLHVTDGGTTEKDEGTSSRAAEMDTRRLYSVILGGDEGQDAGQYFSGSVAKFALYPKVTTSDIGKNGALFYFDFADSTEDLANSIPARSVFHHKSTDRPVYTAGGDFLVADGGYVGIGGGIALTEFGAVGYASALDLPLGTDVVAQQQGNKVFITSGGKIHVLNTDRSTIRTLGLPEPGTDVYVNTAGAGVLDGIYSYGYRFVSVDGTASQLRRINSIEAFNAASVQVGIPRTGSGAGGDNGERELGSSLGYTESTKSNPAAASTASYFMLKSPDSTGELLDAGDYSIDTRMSVPINDLPECIFNRGVRPKKQSTAADRYGFWANTRPPNIEKGDATVQVAFRYQTVADDNAAGAHATHNNNLVTLFSFAMPDSDGNHDGYSATWMVALDITGTSGFVSEGGPRLVCYAKKHGLAHWKRFTSYVAASSCWDWDAKLSGFIPGDDTTGGGGSTSGIFAANTNTGIDGSGSFWLEHHDYNVVVAKKGNDLHIAAYDVTGIEVSDDDPYTADLATRAFYGTHTDFFVDCRLGNNPDPGRHARVMFGMSAYTRQNSSGTSCRLVHQVYDDGGTNNFFTVNAHWLPKEFTFYHGRIWSEFVDPLALLTLGWRRDAALAEVKTAAGTDVGPFYANIHTDIAGLSDELTGDPSYLYDAAGSATGAPIHFGCKKTTPCDGRTSYSNVHMELRLASSIGAGTDAVPAGVREQVYPLVAFGSKVDGDIEDTPTVPNIPIHTWERANLRLFISNLYNGSIILSGPDNADSPKYILGRHFWEGDPGEVMPFQRQLDDFGVLQSGGSDRFSFTEPTWFSFLISVMKIDETSTSSFRYTFTPSKFRLNGSDPIFNVGLIPVSTQPEHIQDNQMADGFLYLGGYPDVAPNVRSISIEEFRFWVEDRWDTDNTGGGSDLYLSGNQWQAQDLGDRLSSRVCPQEDPTVSDHNRLLSYIKFQPADTAEYGLAVDARTQLGHFGKWAYHDGSAYGADRTDSPIEVEASVDFTDPSDGDGYYAGIWDLQTVSGGNPPNDGPLELALPGGPMHATAAIELFRTQGIPASETQRGDPRTLSNFSLAARDGALRFLVRLPLNDRFYLDSTYDDDLGYEVNMDSGTAPPDSVTGAFVWQDQLCLLAGKRDVYFSEPGPFGWESFPPWGKYSVPIETAGGDATAGVDIGSGAVVMGTSWAVLLGGQPNSPAAVTLSSGVGATDATTLVAHSGAAFAFNGKLWRIAGNGESEDIGRQVQDLLPAEGSARLAVSSNLASLLVLDTGSGTCLRLYFPTGEWFVEDRGALSVGDLADGTDAWVSPKGVYAKGDTTRYADFTWTNPPAAAYDSVVATAASGTITLVGGSWDTDIFKAGLVVTVVKDSAITGDGTSDSSDLWATGVVTAIDTGTLTVGVDLTTKGLADSDDCYVYVGGPVVLDSGPLYTPNDATHRETTLEILAGSSWHLGARADYRAGELDEVGAVEYVSVASNAASPVAGGQRGRFHRIIARDFAYEEGHLGELEIDVE